MLWVDKARSALGQGLIILPHSAPSVSWRQHPTAPAVLSRIDV